MNTTTNIVRGLVFRPGERVRPIELKRDRRRGLLDSLYAAIDCTLVEKVSIGDGVDLIVDEEGMLRDQPVKCGDWTIEYARDTRGLVRLYGTVVAVGYTEGTGEWRTMTVDEAQRALAQRMFPKWGNAFYQWRPTPAQLELWLTAGVPW